jgi:hypothetical protein
MPILNQKPAKLDPEKLRCCKKQKMQLSRKDKNKRWVDIETEILL